MMAVAINFVLFQLGWFACVLGAARGFAREGTLLALVIVAAHVLRAARPRREFALVAAATAFGALADSALASTGWLRYDSGILVEGAAPYWIVALWALFATTLNVSLRWLRGRLWIAALLGAASGPAAFYAGAGMGALHFVQLVPALTALAVGWAIATPLLVGLAQRLERT